LPLLSYDNQKAFYETFPRSCSNSVRRFGIEGVQGNYDEAVANDREHCGKTPLGSGFARVRKTEE
jgi:hypothetical protein